MAELLAYQRYDTSVVAARERFDYWRTWYDEAVTSRMRLEPVGGVPNDFRSSAAVLQLGEVTVSEVRNGRSWGGWQREATEDPDLFRFIMFLRSPDTALHWHDHDLAPESGSLFLIGRTGGWWRAPYGLSTIQVNVPRTLIPVHPTVIDRITGEQRPPGEVAAGAMAASMLAAMAGRLEELSEVAMPGLDDVWIAMATMVVRSLAGLGTDGQDAAPVRRLLAERFIDAHLTDPRLGPDLIASALHMSRRSLYQLMSPTGEGIAASIRRRRLARARAMLADPAHRQLSIGEIAAAVGVPSAAHFSRLFRAEYGVTPRELRAATGG